MFRRVLAAALSLSLAPPLWAGAGTVATAPSGARAPAYTGVFDPALVTREWQMALGSFASWAATSGVPEVRAWGGLQDALSPMNTDPAALAALAPLVQGLQTVSGNVDMEALRVEIGQAYRAGNDGQTRILGILTLAAARGALQASEELRAMVDGVGESPERAAAALLLARRMGDLRFYGGEPRRQILADLKRMSTTARQLHVGLKGANAMLADALGEKPAVNGTPLAAAPLVGLQPALAGEAAADLVSDDPAVRRIVEGFLPKVAPTDSTVLIRGESGTGKTLLAKIVHDNSNRRDKPFLHMNVTAIPEGLAESILFGHKKGAFTGADRDTEGLFQQADGGTLFLDEIGDLSPALQAKILTVLENGEIRRVGDSVSRKVSVRIIAATNQDIEDAKKFRQDLYYRISPIEVEMPPLRNRPNDVIRLAQSFLDKQATKSGQPAKTLSPAARSSLLLYDWPGNIRELQNAMEHAFVLSNDAVIAADELPAKVRRFVPSASAAAPASAAPLRQYPDFLTQTIEQVERMHIETALRHHGWKIEETAAVLGIASKTLRNKIKAYGIVRPTS